MAWLSNSSAWPRPQSGKIIVIYPPDPDCFRLLLTELDTALRRLQPGPRVLSDRQFGVSGLISYRYGAFEAMYSVSADGSFVSSITSPSGEVVPDRRQPWYECPDWVEDPLGAQDPEPEDSTDIGINGGRYLVEGALKFSNAGGVYTAIDQQTGAPVIIKEARPGVWNPASTYSSQELLKREHGVLCLLSDTQIGAKPVDFFEESGHLFSVQSKLAHDIHLGSFSTSQNPLYTKSYEHALQYMRRYLMHVRAVADYLSIIHGRGLVHGDLSFTNVLCTDLETALIDFGSSYHPGSEKPSLIGTPGLGWASSESGYELDIRALGYLMAGCYILPAGLSEISPDGPVAAARLVAQELGWDDQLADAADECIHVESADATSIEAIQRRLRSFVPLRFEYLRSGLRKASSRSSRNPVTETRLYDRLANYMIRTASPENQVSLYRCSPMVYERTPFAISWGTPGVLFALTTLGTTIPEQHLNWWKSRVSTAVMPAGLYTGAAGNALLALKLGHSDLAARLMERSVDEQSRSADLSLFHGASGVGLACHEMWRSTADTRWRAESERLAAVVAERRQYRQPDRRLGLALGPAGESMLMGRMYDLTRDPAWLDCGRAMLESELDQLVVTDAGHSTCRASTLPEDANTYVAYWDEGTAGLLAAVCHWILLTKDEGLRVCLPLLLPDCQRIMTATGGLHVGMAGLGMALLDAHAVTMREDVLASARHIAANLRNFYVDKGDAGVAFAGWQNMRFACDLAYGASGAALFLWRAAAPGRGNPLPGFEIRA